MISFKSVSTEIENLNLRTKSYLLTFWTCFYFFQSPLVLPDLKLLSPGFSAQHIGYSFFLLKNYIAPLEFFFLSKIIPNLKNQLILKEFRNFSAPCPYIIISPFPETTTFNILAYYFVFSVFLNNMWALSTNFPLWKSRPQPSSFYCLYFTCTFYCSVVIPLI